MGYMVIFSHIEGITNVALLLSLIVRTYIKKYIGTICIRILKKIYCTRYIGISNKIYLITDLLHGLQFNLQNIVNAK